MDTSNEDGLAEGLRSAYVAALTHRQPSMVDFEFLPPPTSPDEERILTRLVDAYVAPCAAAKLSQADQASLRSPEASDETEERFHRALDEAILELTPAIGWQVLYSNMIRARVAAWTQGGEAEGARLFKRFAKAFQRYIHVKDGGTLPVTPAHREFKDAVTDELRNLQRQLRMQGALRGSAVLDAIRQIVCGDDSKFPRLHRNWHTFEKLAARNDADDATMLLERFAVGDLGASPLADRWIAAVLNRSYKTVRQELTRVRHLQKPRK